MVAPGLGRASLPGHGARIGAGGPGVGVEEPSASRGPLQGPGGLGPGPWGWGSCGSYVWANSWVTPMNS